MFFEGISNVFCRAFYDSMVFMIISTFLMIFLGISNDFSRDS